MRVQAQARRDSRRILQRNQQRESAMAAGRAGRNRLHRQNLSTLEMRGAQNNPGATRALLNQRARALGIPEMRTPQQMSAVHRRTSVGDPTGLRGRMDRLALNRRGGGRGIVSSRRPDPVQDAMSAEYRDLIGQDRIRSERGQSRAGTDAGKQDVAAGRERLKRKGYVPGATLPSGTRVEQGSRGPGSIKLVGKKRTANPDQLRANIAAAEASNDRALIQMNKARGTRRNILARKMRYRTQRINAMKAKVASATQGDLIDTAMQRIEKKASGPFKKKDTVHWQAVIVDKGVAAGKPVTRVDEDDEIPAYYSDERGTPEDAQIWSREEAEAVRKKPGRTAEENWAEAVEAEAEAARKERKKKSKKEVRSSVQKKAFGAPTGPFGHATQTQNASRPSPPRPQPQPQTQPLPQPLPMHKNTGDPSVGKNHPQLPERQMGQYPGGFFPNIGSFMRRTFTPKSYWNNERAQQKAGLPNTEGSIQAYRRGLSPNAQKTIAEQKALSTQRTQAAAARQQPLNLDESPPPATKVQEAAINPLPPSPPPVKVKPYESQRSLNDLNVPPESLRDDDGTTQRAIERAEQTQRQLRDLRRRRAQGGGRPGTADYRPGTGQSAAARGRTGRASAAGGTQGDLIDTAMQRIEKQAIWEGWTKKEREEIEQYEKDELARVTAFEQANPSGYDAAGYDVDDMDESGSSRSFLEPYKELSAHPSWAADTARISYPGTERVIEDRQQREVYEAYLAEKARGDDPARLAALAKLITHSGEDMNPDGIDWGSMSDEDIGRYHEADMWAHGYKDYSWKDAQAIDPNDKTWKGWKKYAVADPINTAMQRIEKGAFWPRKKKEEQGKGYVGSLLENDEGETGRVLIAPPDLEGEALANWYIDRMRTEDDGEEDEKQSGIVSFVSGETSKGLKGFSDLIEDELEDEEERRKKEKKDKKSLEKAVARNKRYRKARRIAKDERWMEHYEDKVKISSLLDNAEEAVPRPPSAFGQWIAGQLVASEKAANLNAAQPGVPAAPSSHVTSRAANPEQALAQTIGAETAMKTQASRKLPKAPVLLPKNPPKVQSRVRPHLPSRFNVGGSLGASAGTKLAGDRLDAARERVRRAEQEVRKARQWFTETGEVLPVRTRPTPPGWVPPRYDGRPTGLNAMRGPRGKPHLRSLSDFLKDQITGGRHFKQKTRARDLVIQEKADKARRAAKALKKSPRQRPRSPATPVRPQYIAGGKPVIKVLPSPSGPGKPSASRVPPAGTGHVDAPASRYDAWQEAGVPAGVMKKFVKLNKFDKSALSPGAKALTFGAPATLYAGWAGGSLGHSIGKRYTGRPALAGTIGALATGIPTAMLSHEAYRAMKDKEEREEVDADLMEALHEEEEEEKLVKKSSDLISFALTKISESVEDKKKKKKKWKNAPRSVTKVKKGTGPRSSHIKHIARPGVKLAK